MESKSHNTEPLTIRRLGKNIYNQFKKSQSATINSSVPPGLIDYPTIEYNMHKLDILAKDILSYDKSEHIAYLCNKFELLDSRDEIGAELFELVKLPRPWPSVHDIYRITYDGVNLEIIFNDDSNQSSTRSTSDDRHSVPRHRVQPQRPKKSKIIGLSDQTTRVYPKHPSPGLHTESEGGLSKAIEVSQTDSTQF